MPDRAANAAECVPEPEQIAGTQLRPFCLGHHLLFRRLGLPYAGSPAADCGRDEILIGVLICAQTYEETLRQLHDGEWHKTQVRWLKDVTKRRTDLEDVEVRFRQWLATGYQLPPTWKYAEGGLKMSAPWEELLKVRLVMAGFSEHEALNGYLPCRWYDYFTAMEITAADACEDVKRWRPIFYSESDHEKLKALKHGND